MGVNNIRVSFSIVCLLFHLHCHLPLCTILWEEKWHNPFFSSPSLWKQVNFIPIFITSHVEANPHPSGSKLTPSPYSSPAFWKLINFRCSGGKVHMIVSFQHILFIFILIIPKNNYFPAFCTIFVFKTIPLQENRIWALCFLISSSSSSSSSHQPLGSKMTSSFSSSPSLWKQVHFIPIFITNLLEATQFPFF